MDALTLTEIARHYATIYELPQRRENGGQIHKGLLNRLEALGPDQLPHTVSDTDGRNTRLFHPAVAAAMCSVLMLPEMGLKHQALVVPLWEFFVPMPGEDWSELAPEDQHYRLDYIAAEALAGKDVWLHWGAFRYGAADHPDSPAHILRACWFEIAGDAWPHYPGGDSKQFTPCDSMGRVSAPCHDVFRGFLNPDAR